MIRLERRSVLCLIWIAAFTLIGMSGQALAAKEMSVLHVKGKVVYLETVPGNAIKKGDELKIIAPARDSSGKVVSPRGKAVATIKVTAIKKGWAQAAIAASTGKIEKGYLILTAGEQKAASGARPRVRISLEEARKSGVPVPFPMRVGQKQIYEFKTKSFQQKYGEIRSTYKYETKVIEEAVEFYLVETTYLENHTWVNGKLNKFDNIMAGKKQVAKAWKDGKFHKEDFPKATRFSYTGSVWPSGKLTIGSKWSSNFELDQPALDSKAKTESVVVGFENYQGVDCVVIEATITNSWSTVADLHVTRSKTYIDYNTGAMVYSTSKDSRGLEGEMKLVSQEP